MDELTLRLLLALGGLLVGLALGWTSRAAVESRRAARAAEQTREAVMPPDAPPPSDDRAPARPRRRLDRSDVIQGVLVLVVLVSTLGAWQALNRVEEANQRIDQISACQSRVTQKLVDAVNERTTYANSNAQRSAELTKAQRTLLEAVADTETTTDDDQNIAFNNYVKAIDAYEKGNADAAKKRRDNPYPTVQEVRNCR